MSSWAPSPAIDHEGWIPALRRSAELTDERYGHLFVFAIYLTVITAVPLALVGLGFADDSTTVVSLLVGLLVQVFSLSFAALATALLYFDLRTREESAAAQARVAGPELTEDHPPPTGHLQDQGAIPTKPGRKAGTSTLALPVEWSIGALKTHPTGAPPPGHRERSGEPGKKARIASSAAAGPRYRSPRPLRRSRIAGSRRQQGLLPPPNPVPRRSQTAG